MDIKILDLNDYPLSERNGTYGGRNGVKEGITYNGEFWLVKYPQKTTENDETVEVSYNAVISEFLGSKIYEILGCDVHKTMLGYRNNYIVVACKDFCEKEGALREIRTLKNIYDRNLKEALDKLVHPINSTYVVDIDEMLIHLNNNPILSKVPNVKERFWECVVIDSFINNNRGNENWDILYVDGKYKLAPIFANDMSFYNGISDDEMENVLSDIDKLESIVLDGETIFSKNGGALKYEQILTLDDNELKEAINNVVPKIEMNFRMIKELIYSVPEEYRKINIISSARKQFYIKSLEIKFEKLLQPKFNNG